MTTRFSVEAIFTAKDYASRVFARAQGNFSRMSAMARQFERANDKVFGSMNRVAKSAFATTAALGGVGIVGAGWNIAKTATDFEQAITNVGAVALQSRNQIGELEKKALELGRDTQFTATQAANAMEVMKRAGFSNADVLSGIGGVLDATAASGLEMADVAGIVSNALKGMGLETSEATRVADVLALASSKTNSTMGTLGESLANVASTARQLHVPLEDTVAAVAMLQDVGLDASVAGSALNTMLTQMAKPPAEITAKLRQWGVSFKDAKGNMLPLQKVLEQLSKASAKSGGTFDKVAFFADLVGMRGQKAAANLAYLFDSIDKDTGKNKVQSLTEQLQNASGAARKMATIRMDTLQGDVTLLGSSLDLVKIAAFEAAGNGLRPLVQRTTAWLNANKDIIASKATEYITRFGEALPEIVYWAEKLARGATVFYTISGGIKAVSLAMKLMEADKWTVILYGVVTGLTLIVTFWPEIKKFWTDNKLAIEEVGVALAVFLAAWKVDKIASFSSGVVQALSGLSTNGIGALDPLHQKIIALGAALAAVQWALAENDKLKKSNEGLGFFDVIGEMATQGTWDPFKAVNEYQNREARIRFGDERNKALAEAEASLQVVSPEERAARYYSETVTNTNTNNSAEITIKDQTGRAYFSKKPKGPGIKLEPSGSM